MPSPVDHYTKLLPKDLYTLIGPYLTTSDINSIRAVLNDAQFAQVCQAMYGELLRLHPSPALPTSLKLDEAVAMYEAARQRVKLRFIEEYNYLNAHHPAIVSEVSRQQGLNFNPKNPDAFHDLNRLNDVINLVNALIIVDKVEPSRKTLKLNGAKITRFPEILFDPSFYPDLTQFWQNITHLDVADNFIKFINANPLQSLQTLYCRSNQLEVLKADQIQTLSKIQVGGGNCLSEYPQIVAPTTEQWRSKAMVTQRPPRPLTIQSVSTDQAPHGKELVKGYQSSSGSAAAKAAAVDTPTADVQPRPSQKKR